MKNVLKDFKAAIIKGRNQPVWYSLLVFTALIWIIGFLDEALAVGLFTLLFLSLTVIFIMGRLGLKDSQLYAVFWITLALHLVAVLFIYYGHFRPFGGGADFEGYHQNAIDVSRMLLRGNFSLDVLGLLNYFPVVIGIIYVATLPQMIIGQLFTVWLAAISVVLVYLLVLQIGGTKKTAFLAGVIAAGYPSYLYFGSLLLKDTVVIPLVLAGLLLSMKLMKSFSWLKFITFFVILTGVIHLRFYVGFSLMFSFIICWPLLSAFDVKRKTAYWLAIILILGFSPLVAGNGYYGFNSFKKFLNLEKITYFREVVYTANSPLNAKPPARESVMSELIASKPNEPKPTTPESTVPAQTSFQQEAPDAGSTFVIETGFNKGVVVFLKNSLQSFTYSLLGPFPWQFTRQRQVIGLVETLPWYAFIVLFLHGSWNFITRNGILAFFKFYKPSLPLLLFSVLALGALSLYINNYGIIARIRIPSFICLISLMCIVFNESLENYHEKISNYGRSRLHWLPFIKKASASGQ